MKNSKRNTIKTILSATLFFFTGRMLADGNPYRDRFQSYRQTFRIEPNEKETERN